MNIKISNIMHAIVTPITVPVLRALEELLDDVRKTSPTIGLLVVFTLYNLLFLLGALLGVILGLELAVMFRVVGNIDGEIVGLEDGIEV